MSPILEEIIGLVITEAHRRYHDEKAGEGHCGSIPSKIHSVMMDLALELGERMETEKVEATCVEEV